MPVEDIADSTNYALRKCGFPERTIEEVNSFEMEQIILIANAVPTATPKEN